MNKRILIWLSLLVLSGIRLGTDQDSAKGQVWDGSQTIPAHLIQLKDEYDQLIIPSESYTLPFSARYTCVPCHDYAVIEQGLHFNSSLRSEAGRGGEPWVWVDSMTGTVLPLSYHAWEGSWRPEDVGLLRWNFLLLFGRHMTGGGIGEPKSGDISPESRWNVSGFLEINCLGCHNASRIQSHSEWAKQVLRQNFRWAATAASGLGEVKGMASRLPETWDIYDGPNPDDSEWAVVPTVEYHGHLFDSKHRVFLDMEEKPSDRGCLVCHSVSPVKVKKSHWMKTSTARQDWPVWTATETA